LSLDPPKKDLKLAGPGPSFQKSRVRVQKNKPGPKDPGTRHIPTNYIVKLKNETYNQSRDSGHSISACERPRKGFAVDDESHCGAGAPAPHLVARQQRVRPAGLVLRTVRPDEPHLAQQAAVRRKRRQAAQQLVDGLVAVHAAPRDLQIDAPQVGQAEGRLQAHIQVASGHLCVHHLQPETSSIVRTEGGRTHVVQGAAQLAQQLGPLAQHCGIAPRVQVEVQARPGPARQQSLADPEALRNWVLSRLHTTGKFRIRARTVAETGLLVSDDL